MSVFLLVLIGAWTISSVHGSSSIGTCRDGTQRINHARKTLKSAAGELLDAFVGLAELYNREVPSHSVGFGTWILGYKSATIRADDVEATNATVKMMSWPSMWNQVYTAEWPRMLSSLCSASDLAVVVQSYKAYGASDTATYAQKEAFFWDGFGYLKNQTWTDGTPIKFAIHAGYGYSRLIAFDQVVLQNLSRS